MMLNREAILGLKLELPRESVEVPEWGGSISVRVMTGAERDRFEVRLSDTKRANYRAALVAFSACDETGSRLFVEADIERLGKLPAAGLDKVATVSLRLNKFTADDVEELAKNSEANPSGDSVSDSPATSV